MLTFLSVQSTFKAIEITKKENKAKQEKLATVVPAASVAPETTQKPQLISSEKEESHKAQEI